MATIFETMHIRDLTNKWEQKKQNYTKQVKTYDRTSEQRQMDSMMEMLKRERDSTQKGNLMNSIDSKIKSGGTLTPEEEAYLKENAPEKLRDYQEVKAERESYKQKLKACKTKEDVARVKMTTLGNFMSQAKSIDSSPHIPKDKKLELMGKLAAKVANCEQAHQEFEKSRAFRDMPSEEEIREEEEKKQDPVEETYEELAIDDPSLETESDATPENVTGNIIDEKSIQVENASPPNESTGDVKAMDFADVKHEIDSFFQRNDDGKRHFVVKV